MATTTSNKRLEVSEASLITLWNEAVRDYDKQLDNIDGEKKGSVFSHGKAPRKSAKDRIQHFREGYRSFEDVLRECPELKDDFVRKREGTGVDRLRRAFSSLSTEIGLAAGFVKFAVDAAAIGFPPVAPVGVLMSAFTWLWKSFNNVSSDFSKITEFFETMQETFNTLKILEDQLNSDTASEQIKDHIINIFRATLALCGIAMDKPEHRFKYWAKKTFQGDQSLEDSFRNVERSILNLFRVLHISTFKNSSLAVRLMREMDTSVRQNELNATVRHDTEVSFLMELRRAVLESSSGSEKKKESKDPAARRDTALLQLRQELGTPVNQSAYLKEMREYRVKKCHDWFFSQKEGFSQWFNGDSPVFAVFGTAGLGKTHLSLSIIDELQKKETKVAGFFFRKYREDSRNLKSALLSLACQIAETDSHYCRQILTSLTSDGDEQTHSIKEMGVEDLWEKLFTAPFKDRGPEQLYILFDGLDAADQDTQERVPKLLRDLHEETSTIRVIITTRSEEFQIEEGLHSVTLTKEIITAGLRALCTERLKHLPRLKKFHRSVKNKITQEVARKADGMLYAKNVLLRLESIGLEYLVLDEIKNLPDSLDDLYDRMLDDCRKGRSQLQSRALEDLFTWLASSMKPLSLKRSSQVVKLSALMEGHSSTEAEGDILVIHEEVMGKLSTVLEITRASEVEDDEKDIPEKDGEDHDADEADLKLDNNGLYLLFQERRFQDHFTSKCSSLFTANVRILTMCVHLICELSKRPDLENLRLQAAEWWGDHVIELDRLYKEKAEELSVAETFKQEVWTIAESLCKVMTNVGNVAEVLEDHATELYREYRVPKNERWPDIVCRLARLAIEACPGPDGNTTLEWAKTVVDDAGTGKFMLALAQGHSRNWLVATEPWRSKEAFRFARDALLLTNISIEKSAADSESESFPGAVASKNISIDELAADSESESFPIVVVSIAQYFLSIGASKEDPPGLENNPKACRAVALVLEEHHKDEAARMFEESLHKFSTSPLDSYHSHMGLARTHWLVSTRLRHAREALSLIEKLSAETLSTEKLSTEKLSTEKLPTEKLPTEKPSTEKLSIAEIRRYKRSALIVLADLENLSNEDEDQVINLLNQAKDILIDEPIDGSKLNDLIKALENRDGLWGLMEKSITKWTDQSIDGWLEWAIEQEDQESISRFEDAWLNWTFQAEEDEALLKQDGAARIPRREKFLQRILERALMSESTRFSFWAKWRLARTYRFVLGDVRTARHWLRKILEEEKTTVPKQILYEARLDMADIVYEQFRDNSRSVDGNAKSRDPTKSGRRVSSKAKQDKPRDRNVEARDQGLSIWEIIERNFPKLDQDDLKASLISIPLARIHRASGNLKEFERVLRGTFNVCAKTLNDNDTGNDAASFRLLAMALSFFEDLEEDAKIALSLQFSEISPNRANERVHDREAEDTENTNVAENDEKNAEPSGGEVHDNVVEEKGGPLSEEKAVDNADDKTQDDKNQTTKTTVNEDSSDLPSVSDPEDIEPNAYVWCDGCGDRYGWWSEHLYHCLICVDCDLCHGCWERRKNAKEHRVEGKQIYCGRNHKYMKGPIAGWRGVQAGKIIRRGKLPLDFDDWLNGLKDARWPNAWKKFWTDEYFVRDIM